MRGSDESRQSGRRSPMKGSYHEAFAVCQRLNHENFRQASGGGKRCLRAGPVTISLQIADVAMHTIMNWENETSNQGRDGCPSDQGTGGSRRRVHERRAGVRFKAKPATETEHNAAGE